MLMSEEFGRAAGGRARLYRMRPTQEAIRKKSCWVV